MDLHTAGTLLSASNLSLLVGAILVAVGTFGAIKANSAIQVHAEIRQLKTDVKIAEATEASSAADARAAEANLKSAEANERAAKLEKETSLLKKQAEEAKAETARVNERLQKIQAIRRLTKEQAQKISDLVTSDKFKIDPPVTLRVASVADSESQMFAMDFLNLLSSCRINVSPTPYWAPNVHVQTRDSELGLLMHVKSTELAPERQPFVLFANLLESMGLETDIQVNTALREDEAILNVLRKPSEK